MSAFRAHSSVALFLVVALCFAVVPGMLLGAAPLLTFCWLLAPTAGTLIRRTVNRCDEQSVSLLTLLPSRAPPVFA